MQTVLFVSPVTLGDEVQIRQVHEILPTEAIAQSESIERMQAFVGSGFYALELAFADGDFQERYRTFVSLPEVQTFFDALRPYVQSLPFPDDETAEVLLASPIVYWEQGLQS